MTKILPCLFLLLINTISFSQPVIDGAADDAQYITLASWNGAANWSPSNQLGSLKYFCNGSKMYVAITGKLEQNWNKLLLVFNFSGYSGVSMDNPNELPSGFNSFFQGLAGTQLGIETDFALSWTCNNSPLYCDGQRYGTSTAIQGGYLGSSDQSGNASSFDENSVKSALGGSTGGFTQAYRNDFDRTTNPDHGLEFSVDLSAFPGVTGSQTVSFFAVICNNDGTWLSNQTLPDYYNTGLFNGDFGNHPNISWMAWNARTNQGHSEVYFFTQPVQPLPVELISFTAAAVENGVLLKWETKSEFNNHGWEIQRRIENSNWETLAFSPGQGNSNSTHYYSFLDKSPKSNAKYFYRLKQIDNDGSYELGPEREVEFNFGPSAFEVFQNYPNPFNPTTLLKFQLPEASKVKIIFFNSTGQEVKTINLGVLPAGINETKADLHDLRSGVYYYKLTAALVNSTQMLQATKKLMLVK